MNMDDEAHRNGEARDKSATAMEKTNVAGAGRSVSDHPQIEAEILVTLESCSGLR